MPTNVYTPVKRRVGRRRRQEVSSPPVPVALLLAAASFDEGALTLTLTFSRAVDAAGVVGAAITVDDGEFTGFRYEAILGVTVVSPTTIRLGLMDVVGVEPVAATLTASGANGIVASDDGAAWDGVTGVVLPFAG